MPAHDERSPDVSVIVCTRDRPNDVAISVPAILSSKYRDFELIVVDQSSNDISAEFVQRLAARDSRIRLIRDRGKGSARAHNLAIAGAKGEILVFTDDDCQPAADWLGLMVEALRTDLGAGVAYGTTLPAPHDAHLGFIVGYVPSKRRRLKGRLAKLLDGGIGANMAARRAAVQRVGGFDEMLGPGAYFPACMDGDLTYRILRSGYAVLHLPEAQVLHYGLRPWSSGSKLIRQTFMSIAAAYSKYVRAGDAVGVLLLGQQFAFSVANIMSSTLRGRTPLGVGRLVALLVGVWRSFELEVDPRSQVYRSRTDP